MGTLDKFIEERRVEGALLDRLKRLSAEDSAPLCRIIEALNPSANTVREIVSLAEEIGAAGSKTLGQVLEEERILVILRESALPAKVRQTRLRSILEQLRYPLLSSLRQEVSRCVDELITRYGIRVLVPEDFEGDTLRIELTFRSVEHLENSAGNLLGLSQDPALLRVFAILRGEV